MVECPFERSEEGEERLEAPVVLVVAAFGPLRGLLGEALADGGYRVLEATGATDAIQQIRSSLPSAVLLDFEIRDSGGREVYAYLAGSERAMPAVLMVSPAHRHLLPQGLDGAVPLLLPFSDEALLNAVSRVLRDGGHAQAE